MDMKVLEEEDAPHTADCAETLGAESDWECEGATASVVAFAGYELDKISGERVGSVWVKAVDHENGKFVKEIFRDTTLSGVFDLKWSSHSSKVEEACLASAHANGKIMVHMGIGKASPKILETSTSLEQEQSEGERFCLSVDWNNRVTRTLADARIAVSSSNGTVSCISMIPDSLTVTDEWSAHTYDGDTPAEVWITAFDCHNINLLATGADEGLLKFWDLRTGTSKPVSMNRSHDAGVCSIQFSTLREHTFVTGSYDSQLRIWDSRRLKQPVSSPLDLEAGIWRVKWHPTIPHSLLVASMRSGFILLDCTAAFEGSEPEVVSRFNCAHAPGTWEALAYGADWIVRGQHRTPLIAGASFYDKKVRILLPES